MELTTPKTIDADEARLYDRQIRLWGVEAQNRMKNSKVLIVGLRGLQTEVCKNIVLSGIDTAYILDPDVVQLRDLSACFFLSTEDVGKNRAEASAPRIQELNPRVKVIVDKEGLENKPEEFFQQFNVVCLSDSSIDVMIKVDNICRKHKIALFSGFLFGFHGVVYMDHNGHQYKETKKLENEEESVSIRTCDMPDFKFVFDGIMWNNREFRRTPKLLFAHQSLLQFEKQNKTNVSLSVDGFIDFVGKLGISKKLQGDFIPVKVLREVWFSKGRDLSPVAAIVGGVVAQEIIKVLSGKDEPLGNCFVFDGQQSRGVIEKLFPQAVLPATAKFIGEAIEL